ncbi:hypothetical protein AX760_21645 [Pararhizobium antarcticum]|uniref:PAC domain-containing protein n=1 Tax=Pararhizobium antarcticum TaxID=1798805 RepID=A0A657LSS1_9HYPH|nr:hypothetical protein AX760_21645 [Pararhizobium antarcticum]OJF93550.1 hypothetical protein AX761_20075 [Rhizobium sp. 58]
MKDFIALFWLKYSQLQLSVRSGDDLLTGILDAEIEPLLRAIYESKADNVADARAQFQLLIDILKKEAEDVSSVLRHSHILQALVDRYFSNADADTDDKVVQWRPMSKPAAALFKGRADEGFLNEAILDCLPDRIAVITTDYRYLYTNPVNADRLELRPIELVGRHIVEFVGIQRFEQRVRPNLDKCFAGETVDYTFSKEMNGRTVVVRCRMNPCRSGTGKLIGAILVLQEIADRRRAIAA